MKRVSAMMLAALLTPGLSNCKRADQKPSSSQSTLAEQSPMQDKIIAAYDTIAEVYHGFDLMTMPINNADNKKVGGDVYNRMDITTMAELKVYLNTLFYAGTDGQPADRVPVSATRSPCSG